MITGESYAGHYIPIIGAKLKSAEKELGMKLIGVAIGNGIVS